MPPHPSFSRVGRFLDTYSWLAREHLLTRKLRLAATVALSALGAVAQGGTIAFIAVTVDFLQTPRTIGVAWLDAAFTNTLVILVLFGALLLVVSAFGAWATYLSSVIARALARQAHWSSAVRAVHVFSASSSLDNPNLPETVADVRRLIVRSTMHLGKAVESLAMLAAPMCRVIVAAGILFWVDLKLSLIVAPLFLLLVPVLYRLASTVQSDARGFFEDAMRNFAGRIGAVVTLINAQNVLSGPMWSKRMSDLYGADHDIQTFFNEYDRLQLAQERVRFKLSLVTSVFLAVALVAGGYMASGNAMQWGLVAAFLLALLQMINSLKAAQGLLTNLSMFYPSVRHYRTFVLSSPEQARPDAAAPHVSDGTAECIRVRPIREPQDGTSPVVMPGDPVYYMTAQTMSRLTLAEAVQPLIRDSSIGRDFAVAEGCFVALRNDPGGGSVGEYLAAADDGEGRESQRRSIVDALGVRAEVDQLPQGLDTDLSASLWRAASPALKLALILGPLQFDRRRLLLLDVGWFLPLKPGAARRALSLFDDRYILLVSSRRALPPGLAERVIVTESGRVKWFGPVSMCEQVIREAVGGRDEAVSDDLEEQQLEEGLEV